MVHTSSWVVRRYLLNRPVLAAVTAGITIASAAVEVAFPWLLQHGIDVVTGERSGPGLTAISLAMLAVAVVIVAGYACTLAGAATLFGHASYAMRQTAAARLLRQPLAALERARAGALAFRTTSDVGQLEAHLHELANGVLFHGVVTVAAVALMIITSPMLTALVVGAMIVVTWLGTRLGRRLPLYQRAAQIRSARLAGLLQEAVTGAATLRAFDAEATELSRIAQANRGVREIDVNGGLVRALVTPLWHFAELLSVVAVLWYGGSLVMAHRITIGELIGFLAYQQLIADPVSRFGQYFYHWQACRALARRIAVNLGTERSTPPADPAPPDPAAALAVQHLSVVDPHRGAVKLNDVSLRIEPGERVALVGRNGSGKSTLLDALCALQEPSSGDVMLGLVRLSACDPAVWRRSFGLMRQDTMLFHGSLASNLALAKADATGDELAAAVSAAGGARLLPRLHDADPHADISGKALSGGERRVIGLARLILRDPRVALLDEPTTHLDGAMQTDVLAALDCFARGRTMIVATHDLAVAAGCDRLILMDAGRIVADGPARQLIAHDARCRELLSAQPGPAERAERDPSAPALREREPVDGAAPA